MCPASRNSGRRTFAIPSRWPSMPVSGGSSPRRAGMTRDPSEWSSPGHSPLARASRANRVTEVASRSAAWMPGMACESPTLLVRQKAIGRLVAVARYQPSRANLQGRARRAAIAPPAVASIAGPQSLGPPQGQAKHVRGLMPGQTTFQATRASWGGASPGPAGRGT